MRATSICIRVSGFISWESMKNVCPFLHMSTTPLYMVCQRSQHSTYIPVHAKHCDGLPSKDTLHSDTAGHNSGTGSDHLVCFRIMSMHVFTLSASQALVQYCEMYSEVGQY